MKLPPEQEAIRAKCFHPSREFVEFPIEDVESSIPARFEKIVQMFPDRIAVKTRDEAVIYTQLNGMANRIASEVLQNQDSQPRPVAILFDDQILLIAAMLGVLKAGTFFVLLDSSFPEQRLAAVLKDSDAELLFTDRQNSAEVREILGNRVKVLQFKGTDRGNDVNNLRLPISAEDIAYITYTSGSTGQPKGVIQNHRNVLVYLKSYNRVHGYCEHDVFSLLQAGTASAVIVTFLALLNGAALVVFDVRKMGVNAIAHWLVSERISVCHISSPLYRALCETLTGKENFGVLRLIRLNGEASHKSDFELYKAHFPSTCVLVNGLAASETDTVALYFMNHKTIIDGNDIPVGYPNQATDIFLLDDDGQEVAKGEVGEIVVRSGYLSPGYWLQPDLTDAKFKPDPRGTNTRVYHSGDLGLMLSDGCLIHKGRKDFRVKIRGYGVDLVEVENKLLQFPAIQKTVVVAATNERGENLLVAYFTANAVPSLSVSKLRSHLSGMLPDYMIPSVFVKMEALPLTPNGKIDRRALPEPEKIRPGLATEYQPPRDEIERGLVTIWQDILDVRPIGINDNFFELGGHSLSATRVISQIVKHLKVELPLQSVFESPTIAGLASLIAQSDGTLSAIDFATGDGDSDLSLGPVNRDEDSVLSYSQQRLWFLDQLEPGGCTYNLFSAYRLKGKLNIAALEASFSEIIRRHEVLRTVFKAEGGEPVPVVVPALPINIPIVDLRTVVSEEERWSEARRIFKEEAQKPFDLAIGPLLRVTLLKLADNKFVLLWAMHHIVYDGWSEGVLNRELSQRYEALLNGRAASLEELPVQYADYAKWQRQWIEGERFASQLSYWKKQLDGIGELQLPTDRPRSGLQSKSGGRRYFDIPDGLSSELRQLSRNHGVTLYMTLLAAFQTLLHRYSGQTDIAIGSPVAGRGRREFEGLIGFFLNMLVLRLDVSGNPRFAETLGRMREMCLGALDHQELPFEKLVEELQPERDLSRNPMFQVTFAFQNTPRVSLRLAGVKLEELEVETGIARFDLHLFIDEVDGHLKGLWEYDTNLFDLETIDRTNGHFQTLLEAIVADSNQRISDLPVLTDAETHQLLVGWNDTRADYPKDRCIHQLFEEQVERTPDAMALVFEDEQLTYRELNQRSNQLAHYLREQGVALGVLVGICLERSIDMIVALLAILKAGAAYVPIDPTYPQERVAYILKDSGVRTVLTTKQWAKQLPSVENAICLDDGWSRVLNEPTTNPQTWPGRDIIAYLIYTSGSTGTPKGVIGLHRGIVNRLAWMWRSYPFEPGEVCCQKTSIGFVDSIWEIFGPLLKGVPLMVVPEDAIKDPCRLVQSLSKHNISRIVLVPSLLRMVLQTFNDLENHLPRLKYWSTSGEQLDLKLCQTFLQRMPHAKLINLYGCSEASADSTYFSPGVALSSSNVPIGRPISNTQIYLLDVNLELVPIGVVGQLFIGGEGLTMGYHGRPDLTAERFVPNPFDQEASSRIYRTGDLARYLPDGNIQYLGRCDYQVKIRGNRVELGEIEAVLGQHPTVRGAVVVAREDSPGDRRLVAYVVGGSGLDISSQELRRHLQQKLPEYMVPSAFVFLDSLPLTPNGKVDRKALPEPEASRPELDERFVSPRNSIEERIAAIWAEVLKSDQVGVYDNFFDLGGHSLVAVQVMARIRDEFQVELPLRTLFENPTVGELAEQVRDTQEKTVTPDKLAKMIADLESMSEDEAQSLVGENRDQKPRHW